MLAKSWHTLRQMIRMELIIASLIYPILLKGCPNRFMQIVRIYWLRVMKL
jgi:hypothetical protein